MTTPKTMLCRCEDITLDECEGAIREGYACFEDLKRFLGVGTGPCQGKSCVQAAMHLVARARGIDAKDVDVMTFRPPVRPVPFETLAADPLVPTGSPAPAVGGLEVPPGSPGHADGAPARHEHAPARDAPSTGSPEAAADGDAPREATR